MKRFYGWLDRKVLPWPVQFLTNPIVILFTFAMLIPLIGFAGAVVFVLVVNSYMNVTSVGVSSIVLRQTMLVAGQQEQRAQQDHDAILAEFAEIKSMHAEMRLMIEQGTRNQEAIIAALAHNPIEGQETS